MKNGTNIEKDLDELFLKFREEGDDKHIDELVRAVNPWLFRMIYRLIGDRAAAKDVLQDTWLIILKYKNNFNPQKGRFINYIFMIAKREALHWKKRNFDKNPDNVQQTEFSYDPDLINDIEELSLIIRNSINKIKNKNLVNAILLHYFAGFKVTEVAEAMKTSEQNVKNWLFRGRSELKLLLEKHSEYSSIMETLTKLICIVFGLSGI